MFETKNSFVHITQNCKQTCYYVSITFCYLFLKFKKKYLMIYKYITYIQLVRPQQQLKPKNKKRKAQNLKRFEEYTRIKLIFHFNFS